MVTSIKSGPVWVEPRAIEYLLDFVKRYKSEENHRYFEAELGRLISAHVREATKPLIDALIGAERRVLYPCLPLPPRKRESPDESATVTSVAVCPHGKPKVYCDICDLEARVKLKDAIAMAVMAERERCAAIADDAMRTARGHQIAALVAESISVKIRSGE